MNEEVKNILLDEVVSFLHRMRVNYLSPMYKISQQKLANKVRLSRQTILRMERGSCSWNTSRIIYSYYDSYPEIREVFSEAFATIAEMESISDTRLTEMEAKDKNSKDEFESSQWRIYQKASQIDLKKLFQEFMDKHADALEQKRKKKKKRSK